MRKMLGHSALGLTAWLALAVTWSALSMVTPLPGPARAAAGSIGAAADAVEAVRLPGPMAGPQRLLASQMRRSGGLVHRIYRAPERLARRLLDRGIHGTRLALATATPGSAPEPPRPPSPPAAPAPPEPPSAPEAPRPPAVATAHAVKAELRTRLRARLEDGRRTARVDARVLRIGGTELAAVLEGLEGLRALSLDLDGLRRFQALEGLELPTITVTTRIVR